MKKLKFIDLCAGIGGFRLAFDKTNSECVLTCEIDKFCKTTYQANFDDNIFEPDIKVINEKTMPDFDILCAGFPCQAFSLAGRQAGFNDTRGTIFFDIARLIKEKRPKAFLLENVKNLKSHDKGKTFTVIENTLNELEYWHFNILVESKYFTPQKRERIYILGLNKKEYSEEQFILLKSQLLENYQKQKEKQLPAIKDILESDVSESFTLSNKLWNFLQEHASKHAKLGNGFGYGLINPESDTITRTLTARYYKDGSEILIHQKDKNPRKLTPRECARLMGFPENFNIPCSNTQNYKQFGNSVVVPVISLFADTLVTFLKNQE